MIRLMRTCAPAFGFLLATAICAADPFVVVVMDPLSKPLSCDCVRGYAQRDYQLLASHLESALGAKVHVVWFESLADALDETDGRADLVIGKHSVVVADMKATGHTLQPIAQLTGKDGDVNQKGLVVVRGDDSVTTLSELRGYRVLFGPADAEEKSSAAEAALAAAGVELPEQRERCGACSEAATALLELPPEVNAAAVISSYAQPLLEGCGSIKKGDLRVIGETKPVPFVTAFVSGELDPATQERVLLSLITAGTKPELLIGLETLAGFVPWSGPSDTEAVVKKKDPSNGRWMSAAGRIDNPSHEKALFAANRWPQFRGVLRDGRVQWLPERLPDLKSDLIWKATMPSTGVGGLMVAGDVVVVSGRDASDAEDCFIALDLATGRQRWRHQYEAVASLDYGNSPRATPACSHGVVVTLGATGVVCALDPSTGVTLWTIELTSRFAVPTPTWGFCGSPLILEGSVLLQVADEPSIICLDLFTGEVRWQVSGQRAAYASLIPLSAGTKVVGVTQQGYFIRRVRDGGSVWSAAPEYSGDFGVPTPVLVPGGLIFTSENNGIQLFVGEDRHAARPAAVNEFLIPDSHTPVLVGHQLLVAHDGLHALDVRDSLRKRWSIAEDWITGYASMIASDRRVLVTTQRGDLLLVSIAAPGPAKLLSQKRLRTERVSLLAHPAIHGSCLLIRVGTEVRCYRLPH